MSSPEEMLSQLVNSINLLSSVVQTISNTLSTFSSQLNSMEEKVNKIEQLKDEIVRLNSEIEQLSKQLESISAIGEKLQTLELIPNIKKLLEGNTALLSDLPTIKDAIANLEGKIKATPISKEKEEKPVVEMKEEKVEIVPSSKILGEKQIEAAPITKPEKPKPKVAQKVEPTVTEIEEATDVELEIRRIENKFKHVTQMINSPQTNVITIAGYLKELRDELENTVGMSPMLYELNAWLKKLEKMPDTDVLLPDLHGELMDKMDDWLTRVVNAMRRKLE